MKKVGQLKKLFNPEILFLLFLLTFSAVPRFWGLGYSHFYGDETKTLYVDKTVPAFDFFVNQRKGPVQFAVVWLMEKVVGGFPEFWIRLPFAAAGLLSIIFFYLFVRNYYGKHPAVFASLLYSVSGFSVAFSRTAQYQSILLFSGFAGLYFLNNFVKTRKALWGFLTVVSFVTAFLTHYDSVFFFIPAVLLYGKHIKENMKLRSDLLIKIVLPILILCAIFYVPYILKGSFAVDTINYLGKRVSGKEFLPNNSLYTIEVYNPGSIFLVLLVITMFFGLLSNEKKRKHLFIWFFVVFVVFEVLFQNPGTHILSYLLPLYILFGVLVNDLLEIYPRFKTLTLVTVSSVLFSLYIFSLAIFVPFFRMGYPWIDTKIGLWQFFRPSNKYQLFLYGFPYNVGWDKVADYMCGLNGVRGYFTNDNDTVGAYYLMKYPQTPPGTNFLPQYYIHFLNPQELRDRSGFIAVYNNYYNKINEIYVEGEKTCEIYKSRGLLFNGTPYYPSN